jgi:RNA 3'-terminal phosphate cyclase (ATP)
MQSNSLASVSTFLGKCLASIIFHFLLLYIKKFPKLLIMMEEEVAVSAYRMIKNVGESYISQLQPCGDSSVDDDATTSTLTIDGSMMEGGGQVIRSALSLSFMVEDELMLHSIRAGRADKGGGGLKPQHLESVRLAAKLSNRQLTNDFKGSTELSCIRTKDVNISRQNNCFAEPEVITADTGTAGALTLILQAALPPLLFANKNNNPRLRLIGGTDVDFSPPIAHFQLVLAPLLKRMGAHVEVEVVKRGFCPRGGGELLVGGFVDEHEAGETCVNSTKTIKPIHLNQQGVVQMIRGVIAFSPGFAREVTQSLFEAFLVELQKFFPDVTDINVEIDSDCADANQAEDTCQAEDMKNNKDKRSKKKRMGIISSQLAFHTDTGNILSINSLRTHSTVDVDWIDKYISTQVHKQLVFMFDDGGMTKFCVDEHTADQLVVWMALAAGKSSIVAPSKQHQTSQHLETVIVIAEMLTGAKFLVKDDGSTVLIECEGVGQRIK